MPMFMPSAPPPSELSKHALDLADYFARLVGGLAALWVAVSKIAKPYTAWRRRHFAEIIKDVLSTELEQLGRVVNRDGELREWLEKIYHRQERIFEEMDLFLAVSQENHDRVDELNGLLDAMGLTSERRMDATRRERVDQLLAGLNARQVARARGADDDDLPPISGAT